jgi:hypothetical protein
LLLLVISLPPHSLPLSSILSKLTFFIGGIHVKIPGEMWLAEYVKDTLVMGDCDEVCGPNSAIAKHVQLQHLVSLWSLLDEKLNVDPFKDISHKYKKPLTVCLFFLLLCFLFFFFYVLLFSLCSFVFFYASFVFFCFFFFFSFFFSLCSIVFCFFCFLFSSLHPIMQYLHCIGYVFFGL